MGNESLIASSISDIITIASFGLLILLSIISLKLLAGTSLIISSQT